MIQRLLRRLHRIFNKNPANLAVISVAGAETTLTISALRVVLKTAVEEVAFPLSDITLEDLTQAFTDAGYSASLLVPEYSAYPARGLFETTADIGTEPTSLLYPTSIFYKEMQTYGWMLQDQADRITAAENQMDMRTASDAWLDFWGSLFGVYRLQGESDVEYGPRIFWQIIRPNQNNIALELIVKEALGIDVIIKDAVDALDEIAPELQANAPGRFLLDWAIDSSLTPDEVQAKIDQIKAVVRKYKAAGFDFLEQTTRSNTPVADSVDTDEDIGLMVAVQITDVLAPGILMAGAGWIVGTPGLVVGSNAPIKEQVYITKILDSDGSVQSITLSGG